MKKVISSILSIAFLSVLFVNSSFAEKIQSTEIAQEKPINAHLNQPELTAQEKVVEKLKNNLKKYNENQQKLIRKYENMTDKEFRYHKIKKALIKILKFLVGCGTVGILGASYYYVAKKYYKEGCETAIKAMQEDFEEGFKKIKFGMFSLMFGLFL